MRLSTWESLVALGDDQHEMILTCLFDYSAIPMQLKDLVSIRKHLFKDFTSFPNKYNDTFLYRQEFRERRN